MRIFLGALASLLSASPALADCVIRQSDAIELQLGPFVDSTDGVTAETALTISQADVRLSKCTAAGDCGAWAQVNESTAAAHGENGWYEKDFDATDTGTVGILVIAVHESGALPVFKECLVVETAIYDALYADAVGNIAVNVTQWLGTAAATPTIAGVPEVDLTHWLGTAAATPTVAGVPEVDVTHWIGTAAATPTTAGVPEVDLTHVDGDATAAVNLEAFLDLIVNQGNGAFPPYGISASGTAQSYTAGTPEIVLAASTAAADNDFNDHTITAWGDAGELHSQCVADFTGASDAVTLDAAFNTAPAGTIRYVIWATPGCSQGGTAQTGDAYAYLTTNLGSLGANATAADDAVMTRLGAPAGASVSADIAAIEAQTDDIGAAGAGLTAIDLPNQTMDITGTLSTVTTVGTVNALGNDAIAAADVAADVGTEIAAAVLSAQRSLTGTCDSGSTTTCVDDALTQADQTQIDDRLICFDDSWCAMITGFTPASDTVTTTKTAPSTRSGKAYTIFPATLE